MLLVLQEVRIYDSNVPLLSLLLEGSGSGKTTVANAITSLVGNDKITVLRYDSYYKDLSGSVEEKAKSNFDHPDALETDLLIQHILDLKQRKSVHVPIYDFKTNSRTSEYIVEEPKDVILIEGILTFVQKNLRELIDVKIYVDTDDDIRFIRRLERDTKERNRTVESVINQYFATVRPMHIQFVEPSKKYADLIIPEGGENKIAIEMIVSHIIKKVKDNF